MTDPVKARLLRTRELLADLADLNEQAISEWNRRDDQRLDLEQDSTGQHLRRMQRLYAERGGAA